MFTSASVHLNVWVQILLWLLETSHHLSRGGARGGEGGGRLENFGLIFL